MPRAPKLKKPALVYCVVGLAFLLVFGCIFAFIFLGKGKDVTEGAAAGSLYVAADASVVQQLMPGFAYQKNHEDGVHQDSGYGIFSNNMQLALLKTQEDAQWVLDCVLSSHFMQGATASFVQEVRIQPSVGKILGREEALLSIQGGMNSAPYIVKDAQSVKDICTEFNMTQQEYQALNVSGGTTLVPGQFVVVKTAQTPLIKVKNILVKTETKEIPYSTQTLSDSTLLKGTSVTKQAGVNGVQTRTTTITYIDGVEVDNKATDFVTTKEPVAKIIRKGTKPPADAASAPKFRWPVSGPISSPFGTRWGKKHEGLDIAVPTGTNVKAAAAGTVLRAFNNGDYGLFVEIDHGNGWITRYGHNSKLLVKAGDKISAGQVIALSGSTGHSTGPHCHFEIRKNGVPKDPLLYLP